METTKSLSVLFVGKNNIYTKTLTTILSLSFKANVQLETEIDSEFSRKYLIQRPDYIIIDLNSFLAVEIEKANCFKTEFPESKLIAMQSDDNPVKFPDYLFDEIIFRRKFYLGFLLVLKNFSIEVKVIKPSIQTNPKNATKRLNPSFYSIKPFLAKG